MWQDAIVSYDVCYFTIAKRHGRCGGKSIHLKFRLIQVAYIDTEGNLVRLELMLGTFRPERIESIALRFGVDGKQALENILVGKALNSEYLPLFLYYICSYIDTNKLLSTI